MLQQRSAPARCHRAAPNAASVRRCAQAAVTARRAARTRCQAAETAEVQAESVIPGMTAYLDSLKWSKDGLIPVIVQHIDTGDILMQAFSDRNAVSETFQTRLATFYSRSRKERWCKGETSGHFINVSGIFADCDRDSLIYLGDPIGPACHTGARTCYFTQAQLSAQQGGVHESGEHTHTHSSPATTLYALERTIEERKAAMQQPSEGKPSWTARLLSNPELLCKKVREEAGELCQTLEEQEGKERAASEMADLLYHSMVLCNLQGVGMADVMEVLRKRFGTSGVEEKAARPPKAQ